MGTNGKMDSKPEMGTRSKSDMSANSGVMAEMPRLGMKESVKNAKMDQACLAKARKMNERSEMGMAEESAYPGK